jgi:hypothetical protein
MPVFVVENRVHGNRAFCNFFEGPSPKRLNYGVYDDEVSQSLALVETLIAPVIGAAIRRSDGGIALRPIIRSALNMGDELHSRNSAATLLFIKEMFPLLLDVAEDRGEDVRRTYAFMSQGQYFFLRLSMAYAKAAADAARDVRGSGSPLPSRRSMPSCSRGTRRTTSSTWAARARSTRPWAWGALRRRRHSLCRSTKAAAPRK